MNNIQPSMFQQYQKNKDNIIDFVPFLEQKNHATTVIRNIAQTIFEQFGCGSLFNDDCIKNFGVMSNPANFKITLLNFQPTKSIFAFLSSIRRGHFLSVSNECTFSTDGFGRLFDIKVSYSFVERINSGFIEIRFLFLLTVTLILVKFVINGLMNVENYWILFLKQKTCCVLWIMKHYSLNCS